MVNSKCSEEIKGWNGTGKIEFVMTSTGMLHVKTRGSGLFRTLYRQDREQRKLFELFYSKIIMISLKKR